MLTWDHAALQIGLTIVVVLSATGCPLKDDYFIESNTGTVPTGGSGAVQTGGSGSLGGQGNSGGTTGTSATSTCTAATCTGTCCNGACVDLASDPSNCGACSAACSGGQACVSSLCKGAWSTMAPAPASFAAREKPAFVAMGDRLFIFGGVDTADNPFNDGAIYNPLTNRWTMLPIDANSPTARRLAAAVWTGSLVIVYGGRLDSTSASLADAWSYDPSANRWAALPSNSIGRAGALGVSNSLYSAFWGGWGLNFALLSGAERFDIQASAWAPATSTSADPGVLDSPAWAFTGQYLYLYGGRVNGTTKTNAGYSYNLASNAWSSLTSVSSTLAPTARWGAFGVWDGESYYVWAGRDETVAKNDGALLGGGTWKTMTATGAPAVRWAPARQTGWAFARATGDILVIGGQDAAGNCLNNGGRYVTNTVTSTSSWTPILTWKSGENHVYGVAAYVGGALIVWGGRNGTVLTTTGDRWAP